MGTMGSGKTTAVRFLAHELRFHLLEENFGENVFLSRFYTDMKQ
jgi:deoxyadenosine/deoxycytidine kinase